MAVVAIPGARSNRPLDFATPNWGSDKLRGIQRLVLFDSPTPQDLIRGTQLTRVGSAITRAATPAGFAGMANTAETSYWTLPAFPSDNTRSLSMLWVGLHSGGTTPITIRDNSSSAGNILFWRNAGQWDQRVGGTDYAAAGTFTTNRLYSAVVSCSATAAKTFVDGVLVINGSAPASTGITSPWYINQNGPNAQGPLATTVLLAIWDRPLSDQEATALSLDPWQLFAEHIVVISRAAGSGVSLVVADAAHAHAADAIILTSETALAIADAQHAHTADNVVLGVTGATSLAVADATHAHTVDGLTLTSASVLAVQDALHAHAADSVSLNTAAALVVADASHGHAADNVTLTTGGASLLLADSLHAHTADGVALTVSAYLVVSDALHGHLADVVVFAGVAPDTWVPGPGSRPVRVGMARDGDLYLLALDADGIPVYAKRYRGGPLLGLVPLPGNNPGQMQTSTGVVLVIL